MRRPLLKPHDNCWRVGKADRAAVLIDAADYFASLHRNLREARKTIYFLGWDIDSRQTLLPETEAVDGWPVRVGDFFEKLVRENPDLSIYLLCWDYSSIYTFGREAFQSLKLGLAHERIHFRFDGEHPVSASHHQKVIVIDDQIAYSGGLDVTSARWDTMAHDPCDPRRLLPTGAPFAPFHDVQMAVTGEPARWLGELARERWRLCTGETLEAPRDAGDPGRFQVPDDALEEARLAVARTVPAYKTIREVREVERLFLDTIERTKRYLYVENQYFTCGSVTQALRKSLLRPNGPEVVVVIPKLQDNWISQRTMGTLSTVAICKLREADRYGRFHALYPEDERLTDDRYINVHAKVMVADGEVLRVGSANLNNRSMGLDTECDLVVDGTSDPAAQEWIEGIVAKLSSHHVGAAPDEVLATWRRTGSLWRALQDHTRAPKSLEPYHCPPLGALDSVIAELRVVDPPRPIGIDRLVDDFVFRGRAARELTLLQHVPTTYWLTLLFAVLLTFSQAIAPLPIAASGWALLGAFIGLGMLGVPLNVMVALAACLLPGWRAFALSFAGGVLVAALGFGLGHLASPRLVQGKALYYMTQVKERGGFLPMILVRLFPLSPYTVMNLAAGQARVEPKAFFVGTLVALVPGSLGVVLFVRSLLAAVDRTSFATVTAFVAVSLALALVFYVGARRLSRPASTASWRLPPLRQYFRRPPREAAAGAAS